MNAEWNDEELRSRARVHAALGEPARLAIVDRLLLGDVSPSELGRELGLPSNLLAHHLKLLDQAGLIERSRSEGDHRRTYLRLLPGALHGLTGSGFGSAGVRTVPRVVFVCTHNSARSQLAVALWKKRSRIPTASAGTHPAECVHPQAVALARRRGLALARAHTAHVDDVLRPDDLVIAVCDNAHEELSGERSNLVTDRLHWSVPDPVPIGTEQAFELALTDLTDRIGRLLAAVHKPGEQS